MRDELIGKREGRRVKLRLPARLIMPERGQDVWIVDLSVSGVAIEMIKPLQNSSGLLVWLDFRRVVDLVWQEHGRCGFRFARALEPECLEKSANEGADRSVLYAANDCA